MMRKLALLFAIMFAFIIVPSAFSAQMQIDKDAQAVTRVESGKIEEANAAWWGFSDEDSTKILQNAINSGAKKLTIPNMGKPWIVTGLKLASDQEIVLQDGVVILAKEGAFKGKRDVLIRARKKKNIVIKGSGIFRMRKLDYINAPEYTVQGHSEGRHGFAFHDCENVTLDGFRIEDTGGDGIILDGDYCNNFIIKNITCENTFRQGISVITAENLLIEDCCFRHVSGTAPAAGIDFEPSNPEKQELVNCVVRNCVSEHNEGHGFIVYLSHLRTGGKPVSLSFENCKVYNCNQYGLVVGAVPDNGPDGFIEFKNCKVDEADKGGILVYDKSHEHAKVRFINCEFSNVATDPEPFWPNVNQSFLPDKSLSLRVYRYYLKKDPPAKAPVSIFIRRPKTIAKKQGGVEFTDCVVHDCLERPFMVVTNKSGEWPVYNLRGNFIVHNPRGAKIDFGGETHNVNIKVQAITEKQ